MNKIYQSIGRNFERLDEIRPYEGETISVKGLLISAGKRTDLFKVKLRRGESIVVGHLQPESGLRWDDLEPLAEQHVIVIGRVYFEDIPESYQIFARVGDPYIVDVTSINCESS